MFLNHLSTQKLSEISSDLMSGQDSTCVSTSASPIAPDVDQLSSMAIKPNISVLLIILPYSILLWFLRRICDHEGTEGSVGSGVRDRKKE